MKLVGALDFFNAPLNDEDWIVEPFLMKGSSLLLYGRQGSGKSTLAWQLAHSLSTGAHWLGFNIQRTGPVVYLNLDMPRREFRRLMHRAHDGGIPINANLIVPEGDNEGFDILSKTDRANLERQITELKPIAIVIDTVSDSYQPKGASDINMEVRSVINSFRNLVPAGVVVMLLHERKQSPYKKNEDKEDDADAFSGPTAWEAKVSTSIRLTNFYDTPKLWERKFRLDKAPFKTLALHRTPNGLFVPESLHTQLLQSWPACVPEGERFTPTRLKDVFADVAKRSNEAEDTVRKAFYRAKGQGVEYAWAEALGEM
jgi:RecA-family ATPase